MDGWMNGWDELKCEACFLYSVPCLTDLLMLFTCAAVIVIG
jgi:hypothetical protein